MTGPGLGRRLAGAAVVYGVGDVLTHAIALLLVPLYTRHLHPADYGILNGVNVLVSVLSAVFGLGLGGAVMKLHFEAPDEEARRRLHGTLFLASVLWTALAAAALGTLGAGGMDRLFREVRFHPWLLLGIAVSALTSVGAVPLALLRAQGRARTYRALTYLQFVATASCVAWFVAGRNEGALGSLKGQCWAACGMAALFAVLMAREVRWTLSWDALRPALAFGIPLSAYALCGIVLAMASRYFVERFSSLEDLGLFSLAGQYCAIPAMAFSAVNMAWVPLFFESAASPEAPRRYARFALLFVCGSLGLAALSVAAAPEVLRLVAAAPFHGAWRMVPVLAATGLLSSAVWSLLCNPLFLVKRTGHLVWMTLAAGLLAVGLNAWWAPRHGVLGAALAGCVSAAALVVLAYAVSTRLYPVPYPIGKMAVAAAAAAALAALGLGLRPESALLGLALKGSLAVPYGAVLMLAGVFTAAELKAGLRWALGQGAAA